MLRSKEVTDRKAEIALLALLVALSLILIYAIVLVEGPQWDVMVRYLNGKTLLDFLTTNISVHAAFAGEQTNNLLYYFEPYREPLPTPIFAALLVVFQEPLPTILAYFTIALLFYVFAFLKLGRQLKLDQRVVAAVFMNAYAIYFMLIINGGEMLAIALVLLALVYMLRKSPLSGLLFGMAVLAKYPTIVLLPIVLLLDSRKKMIQAIILELIPILLWMGFDYFMYGNPIYSFVASAANANVASATSAISPYAILVVVAYPIAFVLLGVALIGKKNKMKFKLDYTSKLLIAVLLLSFIGYIIVLPHNDPVIQARYGFLFSVALLLPAAIILNKALKDRTMLKYSIAACAIILLILFACISYSASDLQKIAYYNTDNGNSTIYAHAEYELADAGFGNCRFITNAWVSMIYSGYDAYSPYSVYPGNGRIYYPIIVFKYTGVEISSITNLNQSRLVYNDSNVSIYIPVNATCYRD